MNSMELYKDAEETLTHIRNALGPDVLINEGIIRVSVHFPVPSDYPSMISEFVDEKIKAKIE